MRTDYPRYYCPCPTPPVWKPSHTARGVLAGLQAAMADTAEAWGAVRCMEAIARACRKAGLTNLECDWLYENL